MTSFLESIEKDLTNSTFSNKLKFDLMILHQHLIEIEGGSIETIDNVAKAKFDSSINGQI